MRNVAYKAKLKTNIFWKAIKTTKILIKYLDRQPLVEKKNYQLEELESGQTVNVVLEDEAGEKVNLIPSEELIDNFSSQLEVDGQDI